VRSADAGRMHCYLFFLSRRRGARAARRLDEAGLLGFEASCATRAAMQCCAGLVLHWRCAPRTKSSLPTATLPLLTLAFLFFEVTLQVFACTLDASFLCGEQCQVFAAEAELGRQVFTALLATRHSAIEHGEVACRAPEG
jgi:hypothetical protein